MPLEPEQFRACVAILKPHMNTTPEERQALMTLALRGMEVLNKLSWTGGSTVFTVNLMNNLDKYGTEAVIAVLEVLRDDVGEPTKSEITRLLENINPKSQAPIAPTVEKKSSITKSANDQIFISYSRRDLEFVDKLRGDLRARNLPYWIDKEELTPGTQNWEKELRRAIESSYAIVWVVSPDSLESDYVQDEISLAEIENVKLYPVWANGTEWRKCVPLGKGHYQYIDMRGDQYADGLEQLTIALNGNAPQSATLDLSSPAVIAKKPIEVSINPLVQFTKELNASSTENYPTWLYIHSGQFMMGDISLPDAPPRETTVQEFLIAKTLITQQQYAHFVRENPQLNVMPGQDSFDDVEDFEEFYPDYFWNWNTITIPKDKDTHPVVVINAHNAASYCNWLQKQLEEQLSILDGVWVVQLPSESEWEFAARGETNRPFPWGPGKPDENLANFNDIFGGTTPVSQFHIPDKPFEVDDMIGNVWEWTRDNEGNDNNRIIKGGSWQYGVSSKTLRIGYRDFKSPNFSSPYIGFRVVISRKSPVNE